MVKVEESKNAESNRKEVKVEHAEPCEAKTQSAARREEVMGQDDTGATPAQTNHVKTRPPRSKAASLTPVSAVSVRRNTVVILINSIHIVRFYLYSVSYSILIFIFNGFNW